MSETPIMTAAEESLRDVLRTYEQNNEDKFDLKHESDINPVLFDVMNADIPRNNNESLIVDGHLRAAEALAETQVTPEAATIKFISGASIRIAGEREQYGLAA